MIRLRGLGSIVCFIAFTGCAGRVRADSAAEAGTPSPSAWGGNAASSSVSGGTGGGGTTLWQDVAVAIGGSGGGLGGTDASASFGGSGAAGSGGGLGGTDASVSFGGSGVAGSGGGLGGADASPGAECLPGRTCNGAEPAWCSGVAGCCVCICGGLYGGWQCSPPPPATLCPKSPPVYGPCDLPDGTFCNYCETTPVRAVRCVNGTWTDLSGVVFSSSCTR